MLETPSSSPECPFNEKMIKVTSIKYFISFKWILLLGIIFNFNIGFAATNTSKLKKIDPNSYISDYEEYNEQIINVKKNPTKKAPSGHTIARETISKISMILTKEMKINKQKSERLSTIIAFAAKKYDIDPRIIIAIIKVESNFKQNAINLTSCERTKQDKCGDYSIAQINYETWSKSFPKMGRKALDLHRLKTDETYAIFRMAEILSILKAQYASTDNVWFARYHSSTPVHKTRYTKALKTELRKVISLGPNLLKNFPKLPSKN